MHRDFGGSGAEKLHRHKGFELCLEGETRLAGGWRAEKGAQL